VVKFHRPTQPDICGTIHKSGKFTVQRKTVGKRMAAKLRSIGTELRRRMHQPIAKTGDWLKQVIRGYFNYHALLLGPVKKVAISAGESRGQ
jgi:hypothetical protein